MTKLERILVPVDFSAWSDSALDYALSIADAHGAAVEVLHVWSPRREADASAAIFAETPQGVALESRLSAAEHSRADRVCGRIEFGDEASSVILALLCREPFDLVVMGREGPVTTHVARTAPCKVVTLLPGSGGPRAVWNHPVL